MALFRRKRPASDPLPTAGTPSVPAESLAGSVRDSLVLRVVSTQDPAPAGLLQQPLFGTLIARMWVGALNRYVGAVDVERWGVTPDTVSMIATENLRREPARMESLQGPADHYRVVGVASPISHITRLEELIRFPDDGVLVFAPAPDTVVVHPLRDPARFMDFLMMAGNVRRQMEGGRGGMLMHSPFWLAGGGGAYGLDVAMTTNPHNGKHEMKIKIPPAFEQVQARLMGRLPRDG